MGCCASRQPNPAPPRSTSRSRSRHHGQPAHSAPLGSPLDGNNVIPTQDAPGSSTTHGRSARSAAARQAPHLPLGQRFNQPIRPPSEPWEASRPRSKRQIDRDRDEFWETRVTGREEIWRALKLVVEMLDVELETAQEVLNASGITVPTGECCEPWWVAGLVALMEKRLRL